MMLVAETAASGDEYETAQRHGGQRQNESEAPD
jgi:hypothetical protein